jgi:hypothetical protein
MEPPEVVVVGETPSLGRSVADLLESAGVRTQFVEDLRRQPPVRDFAGRFPTVVVASSGYYCATARQRARGELPVLNLVVIGSRDPALVGARGVRLVSLPLEPGRFLELIRGLVGASEPPPTSAPAPRPEVGPAEGSHVVCGVEGRVSGLPTFK